jgi:hypothetical protein
MRREGRLQNFKKQRFNVKVMSANIVRLWKNELSLHFIVYDICVQM